MDGLGIQPRVYILVLKLVKLEIQAFQAHLELNIKLILIPKVLELA